MSAQSPLGLPPISLELKPISPYLQRADELKSRDPIIAYWCAYYAAQLGISLKAKDNASRSCLFELLGTLEKMKSTIGSNDAIDLELASYAYVENFALRVFDAADDEDRKGLATRATAKKFLAAANFLEVLKVFPKNEIAETTDEKIRYAKWKAADISKAFREGRKPQPGPPGGVAEEPELPVFNITDDSSPPPPHTPNRPAPLDSLAPRQDVHPESWSTAATPGTASPRQLSSVGASSFGIPESPSPKGNREKRSGSGSSSNSTTSLGKSGGHRSSISRKSDGSPPGSAKKVHFSPSIAETSSSIPTTPSTGGIHPSHASPPPVTNHYDLPNGFIPPPPVIHSHEPQLPSAPPLPPNLYGSPPPAVPTPYSPHIIYTPPIHDAPPQPMGVPVPPEPVELSPAMIAKAQKHCRFAISSLDYEDVEQAKKELRNALKVLGG